MEKGDANTCKYCMFVCFIPRANWIKNDEVDCKHSTDSHAVAQGSSVGGWTPSFVSVLSFPTLSGPTSLVWVVLRTATALDLALCWLPSSWVCWLDFACVDFLPGFLFVGFCLLLNLVSSSFVHLRQRIPG